MKDKKAMTGSIAAITALIVVAAAGCQSKDDNAVHQAPLKYGAGLNGFSTTLYPYLRANCATCHGAYQMPKFAVSKVSDAYNMAMDEVNFSEIDSSTFVRKSSDNHCGGACSTDGSQMIQLITAWKATFGSDGPAGEAIPKGNVFTAQMMVPAPPKGQCNLPGDLAISPDGVNGANNVCWFKLRFPAGTMTTLDGKPLPAAIARSWFEVDFAYENYSSDLGIASYVIKNPRVVSVDVPIYVHDVKIFQNGKYHPEYGTAYHMIDTVVDVASFGTGCTIPTVFDPNNFGSSCIPSVQALFSTAASAGGIVQEKDSNSADRDMIQFSFEYYQQGIVGDCQEMNLFLTNVWNPIKIGQVACLNCHTANASATGGIPEAGQRFNMDPNDVNNGSTADARMATICKRFLQRSNFSFPDNSPIIVQPKQGLNGMPAQDNFSFFAPDWITWIKKEASHIPQQ